MIPNFICVQGTDYGATEFTKGSGGGFVSYEEMYENKTLPMCWSGFFKPQWLQLCQQYNLKFYNLDSGYFGNIKKKVIFRLSVNNFQNINSIVERPIDRWNSLKIELNSIKQKTSIVLVPPDLKKSHTLNLGPQEQWLKDTVSLIKQYTNRPIRIRQRPLDRGERVVSNTFKEFIAEDAHCVIGHSSNALVEAAMCDIPVISLGHSATKSLYNTEISQIENLKPANQELKQAWLNHLAYSQFTREELLSGLAWELIN